MTDKQINKKKNAFRKFCSLSAANFLLFIYLFNRSLSPIDKLKYGIIIDKKRVENLISILQLRKKFFISLSYTQK